MTERAQRRTVSSAPTFWLRHDNFSGANHCAARFDFLQVSVETASDETAATAAATSIGVGPRDAWINAAIALVSVVVESAPFAPG
jgi:hypothetical protein